MHCAYIATRYSTLLKYYSYSYTGSMCVYVRACDSASACKGVCYYLYSLYHYNIINILQWFDYCIDLKKSSYIDTQ